jgi:hypothetical protein
MAINPPADNLPLAEVLRAANELVAAIYYVEPFTTYDADIFLFPKTKD